MIAFIDQQRETYTVESICNVLPIAPSTYYWHDERRQDPTRPSARTGSDEELRVAIRRVWDEHYSVYGPRKVWRQLQREGVAVVGCTVRRLMRAIGLESAVRGRVWTTTTHPARVVDRPSDLVERNFTATRPNQLWLFDFTYAATWGDFVYAAFVTDAFARRVVGWSVWASLRTAFVLDALKQPLYDRRGAGLTSLVHHGDRGTQYLLMGYSDRLADAGIAPSVGSRRHSHDNALTESVIGLFKTEVIQRRGPWRHFAAVEFATLAWVEWFNARRLLELSGHVPPAECEERNHEQAKVA